MTVTFTTSLPDDDPPAITDRSGDSLSIDRETTPTNNGHVRIQYRDKGNASWQETTIPYDQLTSTVSGLTAGADVEVRLRTETSHVTGAWTQAVTHFQRTSSIGGTGSVKATRAPMTKYRASAIGGTGALNVTRYFMEAFPSELTPDLDWDFSQDERGFVSEWVQREPASGHGSVALYVEGRMEANPIEVIVEYDKTGNGTPNERSKTQTITTTTQTAVFPSLSGGGGWYRVTIRGLEPRDVLAAVVFGTSHT